MFKQQHSNVTPTETYGLSVFLFLFFGIYVKFIYISVHMFVSFLAFHLKLNYENIISLFFLLLFNLQLVIDWLYCHKTGFIFKVFSFKKSNQLNRWLKIHYYGKRISNTGLDEFDNNLF